MILPDCDGRPTPTRNALQPRAVLPLWLETFSRMNTAGVPSANAVLARPVLVSKAIVRFAGLAAAGDPPARIVPVCNRRAGVHQVRPATHQLSPADTAAPDAIQASGPLADHTRGPRRAR